MTGSSPAEPLARQSQPLMKRLLACLKRLRGSPTVIRRYVEKSSGDRYTIKFKEDRRHGLYRLYVVSHPPTGYLLGTSAHLMAGNEISVLESSRPHTLDRAKVIAFAWIHGFSVYRRTGNFPNGRFQVDIAEE